MIRNKSEFLLIFLCVLLLFSLLSAQMPDFIQRLSGGSVQNSDFKAEIPFTYIDERISVKAKINDADKECTFILDTYSPCMVREGLIKSISLDTLDLTEQMGKKLEGSMMKPLFPLCQSIRLGEVIFKDIGAMAMSEDENNPFLQVLEDGLIGANLLKCCVWQINFQEMKIVITDKTDKLDHLKNTIQTPFTPVPIQQSPNVQITLNGQDNLTVQFDTGNKGFLTLSSESLLSLVDSGEAVEINRRFISPVKKPGTDIETYHQALLKTLKIGEKTFHDLPVGVYRAEDEKERVQGNIGIEFMKHFIVTIDWPEKQIYLTPREDREMKHHIETFGLTYSYFDGAMRVDSIYGGSEAEKKGIKIGDPIIEINGKRVDNLTGDQVQQFLQGKLRFSHKTDDSLSIVYASKGIQKRAKLFSYLVF